MCAEGQTPRAACGDKSQAQILGHIMAFSKPEYADIVPPSGAATVHSLIESLRGWLDSFLHLVVLEGRKAGAGLKLMVVFGVGAAVLLMTAWLALVGCAVAVLVENDILGWAWSLLIAALVSFAGAVSLAYLVMKRSKDLLFYATRRQLGLKSTPAPNHE